MGKSNKVEMGIEEETFNIRKKREKFKARLVAKGYANRKEVDYDEIFSPVIRHTSIRVMFFIVIFRANLHGAAKGV